MATAKRTIRGEQYNIETLVDSAIAAADSRTLDTEKARSSLAFLGNRNPSDAQVNQYARESAILAELQSQTGAAFNGQIGKIGFANREKAIAQVNAYLDRRNAGHRSRWGK
jgi:hypothetical protein